MENGELPTEGVVPHEGTWIEIFDAWLQKAKESVVPHEGTWIEILETFVCINHCMSFPTRERGLK